MGQRNEVAWLRGAVDAAAHELPRHGLAAETSHSALLTWSRFVAFCGTKDADRVGEVLTREVVSEFVGARHSDGRLPSAATMKWRRSALRLLFRVWRDLGICVADPTAELALPRGSAPPCRPLTDDEVALCRWAAFDSPAATRRPAVWALAEAGATSGQIPRVGVEDLDLNAGTIYLEGDAKTETRSVPLTEWGVVQLGRRINANPGPAARSLVYDGSGGRPAARSSVSNALGNVLRRAGLGEAPGVGPRSITAWVGCRVFDETNDIGAVARRLGMRSLDGAAALIGWDWRDQ